MRITSLDVTLVTFMYLKVGSEYGSMLLLLTGKLIPFSEKDSYHAPQCVLTPLLD